MSLEEGVKNLNFETYSDFDKITISKYSLLLKSYKKIICLLGAVVVFTLLLSGLIQTQTHCHEEQNMAVYKQEELMVKKEKEREEGGIFLVEQGKREKDGKYHISDNPSVPLDTLDTLDQDQDHDIVTVVVEQEEEQDSHANKDDVTELFKAIKDNDVSAVTSRIAVFEGDLSNTFYEDGFNVLHYAVSLMNIDLIKVILDSKKVQIDTLTQVADHMTPLHIAILSADDYSDTVVEVVGLLLDYGADIEFKSEDLLTPLLLAISQTKHVALIEYLIERNADLGAVEGKSKHSSLHLAMYQCDEGAIRSLIAMGADVEARNLNLRAPIHEAALLGCLTGIEQLKAWVNSRTPDSSSSSSITVDRSTIDNKHGLKKYYGAASPLHFAAMIGHVEGVKILIKLGAELRAIDEKGNSVLLDYARSKKHHHQEIIEEIILQKEQKQKQQNVYSSRQNSKRFLRHQSDYDESSHFTMIF